jgi:hypothetical protein
MRHLILGICLLLLSAPQGQAQDWQSAMLSSSARLRLFALMAARPNGAADAVGQLQKSQGFHHISGAGPQYIQHDVSLAPYLAFDNNINGGTPGQTILIQGLLFDILPASQAKQGLVGGVSGGASLRISLSPKTVLIADQGVILARALDHDLSIAGFQSDLCLGQYLGRADWLDLCFGHNQSQRALSKSAMQSITLGLSQQFMTSFAFHEASAKLRRDMTSDYAKLTLEMGLISALSNWGLSETRIEVSAPIEGQHTRIFGVSLALTRPFWGQNTTFSVSYAREGGANFFGDPRHDDVIGLGLTRSLIPGVDLSLSLRDRKSSLANYDGVTLGLDMRFSKFTF